VELQGTAEENPFDKNELQGLIKLADKGIGELIVIQSECFK